MIDAAETPFPSAQNCGGVLNPKQLVNTPPSLTNTHMEAPSIDYNYFETMRKHQIWYHPYAKSWQPTPANVHLQLGDLTMARETYICHQCNCVTTKSSGIAKNLFDRFPYADIYQRRLYDHHHRDIPGTVIVCDMYHCYTLGEAQQNHTNLANHASVIHSSSKQQHQAIYNNHGIHHNSSNNRRHPHLSLPRICNMLAQYYPGASNYPNDTPSMRLAWFRQCLAKMASHLANKVSPSSLSHPQTIIPVPTTTAIIHTSNDAVKIASTMYPIPCGTIVPIAHPGVTKSENVNVMPNQKQYSSVPPPPSFVTATITQDTWPSFAFPWNIGCGLAGGNWHHYLAELVQFASTIQGRVCIYMLPPSHDVM